MSHTTQHTTTHTPHTITTTTTHGDRDSPESASIANYGWTLPYETWLGFLETDHDPEDQALPRRLATCASLQIEGILVCGVPHTCSVPRGQNNPGGNRRGAERRFLRECGLSDEEALLHYNLAPLETRRDIAMLGLIHRSVLGCGPRHLANMFLPSLPSVSQKHDKQLLSHRSPRHLQILSRSALGLVDVCNLFPAQVVGQKSVASMQHELQTL